MPRPDDRSPEALWARRFTDATRLSRRDLLTKCAALGALTVGSTLGQVDALDAWQAQDARKTTAWNELGPFYKKAAPNRTHLRVAGDPGLPLAVKGRVLDSRGNPLPGATLEIWHTNHVGQYDLSGYHYRTALVADASGAYGFDSVMPGHYPSRVCQHVHYLVKAPGHKLLTTQLYFATDPVFDGDPDRNFTRDPLIRDRELVRPVTITGDPKAIVAAVTFEIVLERA
jgi:protocatechuate 3,4-dioxygenase beta subunit